MHHLTPCGIGTYDDALPWRVQAPSPPAGGTPLAHVPPIGADLEIDDQRHGEGVDVFHGGLDERFKRVERIGADFEEKFIVYL